ncbi:hypothetical protein TNCV_240381 [Trichonephila clavipes]|nr:hypothetical protein TNCV_240381 [Trichonephila clavipes]
MGNSNLSGSNPEASGESRGYCPPSIHDSLGVYIHWLGVAANEACPLCGHARMDGDPLLQYSGSVEYPADDIVSRY